MNKSGHPIDWRGQTLYLSDRTDKVKQGFCAWVANRLLDNARVTLRADHYYRFERQVMAHLPQWTTIPDAEVVAALSEPDAGIQLLRLHLAASPQELDDAELRAILTAKESDPDSDYARAMRMIAENADPKASGGSFGSPAPTDANEPAPNFAAANSA